MAMVQHGTDGGRRVYRQSREPGRRHRPLETLQGSHADVTMAEPFKNLLNADLVRTASRHLRRVWPAFDRQRFERMAITGLAQLELKARVQHVAKALEAV